MSMSRFQKWTRALVIYTLLVILWGAWVRISHSGDGCGDTWPLCQGKIIPDAQQGKTWVELSHRVMSGLYGFLVLGFFFWARKLFPKGHKARFWAGLSLLFTVTEALLGAKLVLFKLVGTNDTPYRALIMGLHLVNSLLLTGSVTLTGDFAGARSWIARTSSPWTFEGLKPKRIVSGLLLSFFLIGISGAIAALASTLFPSTSLLEGFQADWNTESHYLIRWRGLHPLFGILFGGSIALTAWLSIQLQKPEELELARRGKRLALVTGLGVAFGIGTLVLLSPTWMKLSHLALAHGVWIFLVLWIREVLLRAENAASFSERR
ncbi:MAG: COX15/CtaA family protein [Pseudobdellovibrionaceae bacterium]